MNHYVRTLAGAAVLLAILGFQADVHADDDDDDRRGKRRETYLLPLIPTQNLPQTATGAITITVKPDKPSSVVRISVRGAAPNTLYTIWTVFNLLRWPLPAEGVEVPSTSASTRPGFPKEGNGVSPLARLDDRFTHGMGVDPGSSFVTDDSGNGGVTVRLDYDLIAGAPVSNKNLITQCAPGEPAPCAGTVRITTTWLRTLIGEYPQTDRASMCANYDPAADADVIPDATQRKGMDARLWQCVDPASVNPRTGEFLVRVPRFAFDHFRLANHPDSLTHGHIGGSKTDHYIDMVARRADLRRLDTKDHDD